MTDAPPLLAPKRPKPDNPVVRRQSRLSFAFAVGSLTAHAAAVAALAPWFDQARSPEIVPGIAVEMVFLASAAEGAAPNPPTETPRPDAAGRERPVQPPPPPERQPAPASLLHPVDPQPPDQRLAPPAPIPTPTQLAEAPPIVPATPDRKPNPPPPVERAASIRPDPAVAPAASNSGAAPQGPALPSTGRTTGDAPYSAPRSSGPGLDNPEPRYPRTAQRRGIEGRVLLDVSVSESGTPVDIEIVVSSGAGLLDDAALEAVRQWHFLPAERDGRPVAGTIRVPIVFRLTEG